MGLTKENYYDSPRLSQSKLKTLLYGPKAFLETEEPELFFEEKKYFVIGSAVDTYLTSVIDFNEKYYISHLTEKPSDVVKSILYEVYSNAKNKIAEDDTYKNLEFLQQEIMDSCESHGYYKNLKPETRINKILDSIEYWKEIISSENKTIITQEEAEIVSNIVRKVHENQYTSRYFRDSDENITILKQLPIEFEISEVECKALLDIVYINNIDKTITPIDLKTIGDSVRNFPEALRKRRYDIQQSFYVEALYQWKENNEFKDYKILDFKFIVVSTTEDEEPVIFTCDKSLEFMGKYGRDYLYLRGEQASNSADTVYNRLNRVKGYMDLIDDYLFYVENGFTEDRLFRESGDNLKLDWAGIIPLK
jgi:hypothetical protein|nr:MAG TPA: Exodeoxyribonuclease 8 [Caudoviricetes sp.]